MSASAASSTGDPASVAPIVIDDAVGDRNDLTSSAPSSIFNQFHLKWSVLLVAFSLTPATIMAAILWFQVPEVQAALTGVTLLSAMAICAAMFAVTGQVLGGSADKPLQILSTAITALARGDMKYSVSRNLGNVDHGTIGPALAVLKEKLQDTDRLLSEQHQLVAQLRDDEAKRAAETVSVANSETEQHEASSSDRQERSNKMEEIIGAFETQIGTVVSTLSSAATELQASAETMSVTAEATSQQANAVAAASEEATVNVQTVASSAEELSASIEEISRQVTQSNEIAQNAVGEAKLTNEKVEGLAEAAQKIGDVVNLINDIASQTNLLALNATIEAARAGDAGKGFAVVASEVKSLATQTGKATEEIGSQISAI